MIKINKEINPEEHDYCRGRIFRFEENTPEKEKQMALDEFVKVMFDPEKDAYIYSRVFEACKHKISKELNTRKDVLEAINNVGNHLENLGVKKNDRAIIISFSKIELLRDGMKVFESFFEPYNIGTVPDSKLFTSIQLNDGVSPGQEMGGYSPATDAERICVLGLDLSACSCDYGTYRIDKDPETVIIQSYIDLDFDSDKTDSIIAYTEQIK